MHALSSARLSRCAGAQLARCGKAVPSQTSSVDSGVLSTGLRHLGAVAHLQASRRCTEGRLSSRNEGRQQLRTNTSASAVCSAC